MKRLSIPLGALLMFAASVRADFNPVALQASSFNQDVIAERTGPRPVAQRSATTASVDQGISNGADTWNEQGFFLQDPMVGLPAAGSEFTSISLADHNYRMAPSFAANNAIMLDQGYFSNCTVTISAPRACAQLSFLTSGGNGGCTFTYIVHHADSSTETGNTQSPDWWNGANPAWQGNGRVNAEWFNLDNHNEAGNNPRLYSKDVTLSNQSSPVTSIEFKWFSGVGGGHSAVMAISANNSVGQPFSPLPFTGYNADVVVEATANRLWLNDYLAVPPVIPVTATEQGTNLNATSFRLEGYCWFEQGYDPLDATVGLPHPGNFTSQSQADHHYAMPASYTANNTVFLDADTPNHLITFTTPAAYSALSLLGASAGGNCVVDVVVNFNDSTTETHTGVVIPDWFGNVPIAWTANGRFDPYWGTLEDINSGNPRLYSIDFALVNTTTPVASLSVTRTGGGRGNIFAVSAAAGAVVPLFTTQPQSTTVLAGATVNFSAIVSGTEPITFQWQKGTNGVFVNIPGATASTLSFTAADADEADYRLVASNVAGPANSAVATLTVLSTQPPITAPSDPIIAYQPNGGSSPGGEAVRFAIDGTTQKYLNFGNGSAPIPPVGFIVTPAAGRTFLHVVRFYTANDAPERDPANYIIEGSNDNGTTWTLIASNSIALPDGRNQSSAAPYPPINPATHWLRQVRLANTVSYGAYRVYFTRLKGNPNLMQIAEVEMLGSVDNAGYPVLTTPPTNSYAYINTPVSLYAAATGNPAPTFKWLKNGAEIPGATSPQLDFASAQFSDIADYRVVVANSLQTLTSAPARLTVYSTLSDVTQGTLMGDTVTAYNDGAGTRYGQDANPANVIDGIYNNYRNGGTNENTVSGFPPFDGPVGVIITPVVGQTLLKGIRVYTGNSEPALDPADVAIYGSNDAGATWTPILFAALNLPQDRNNAQFIVSPIDNGHWNPLQEILFTATRGYTSYKVEFTHTRNDNNANSLQISELELLGGPAVPLTFQRLPNGSFQLQWSQGSLLEATDLSGPWTPVPDPSPLTVTPTGPQKFYKVLVQ